jgi:predicted dinucleotide-binding enzyme
MKIGIIGSGDVGRRLADGLLQIGHQVKIGTRDTSKKEVVEWIDERRKKEERRPRMHPLEVLMKRLHLEKI